MTTKMSKRPRRTQKVTAQTAEEAFVSFYRVPPKGMHYVWLAKFDLKLWESQGFRVVPASRHPSLPTKRGRIEFEGYLLMERRGRWMPIPPTMWTMWQARKEAAP
jgi:hypothetical protein